MAFPPSAPETLADIIPAYLYTQYNDDDNVRAFFDAYNAAAQYYLDWFNDVNLPVYTGLSGSLLDWIANGLYDIYRPTIEVVGSAPVGPLNTWRLNTVTLNSFVPAVASTFFTATDDVFKRILTWHLYKGDGKVFTLLWLKRRVLRFLLGANGVDVNVADTSGISITISGDTVEINITNVSGVSLSMKNTFSYIVQGEILELPPQFIFNVVT